MENDLIQRLPTRHEVGREIVLTARRARRLRSLYKLLVRVEADRQEPVLEDSDTREQEGRSDA